MNSKTPSSITDQDMDQLLRGAFPASEVLSTNFEDNVIDQIKADERLRLRRRRNNRLMAVYWGLATTIASGVLAGGTTSPESIDLTLVSVSLMTIVTCLGLVWFVTHQSRINLSELFARTLL